MGGASPIFQGGPPPRTRSGTPVPPAGVRAGPRTVRVGRPDRPVKALVKGTVKHTDHRSAVPGTRSSGAPATRAQRKVSAQFAGTRPTGPGAGCSTGWDCGGASAGPDSYICSLS